MSLLAGPYGPLIKWGGIALAFAIYSGAVFYKGVQYNQTRWDASITKQTNRTMSQVIAEAVLDGNSVQKYIEVKGETREKIKIVKVKEKEYIYANSPEKTCHLDHEFVRLWDAYSGVYNAGPIGLQAPDADPEEPDGLQGTGLTTAELLPALRAAIVEATGYRDAYHALAENTIGRDIVEKAAYESQE